MKEKSKISKYWKEILWLLVVKATLITGIWYYSFSTPIVLDDQSAGSHILFGK